MNAGQVSTACERHQLATDALWRKLLPIAGPQALRIFVLRSVLERADQAPWLRHLRFCGDGRPVWVSIGPLIRMISEGQMNSVASDLMSAVAVKAVEEFGAMAERRGQTD